MTHTELAEIAHCNIIGYFYYNGLWFTQRI